MICPECGHILRDNKDTLANIDKQIVDLDNQISSTNVEIEDQKEVTDYVKGVTDKINNKKSRLLVLKEKLENRIKLKDYKYTNKDVLLVKQAVEELDKFYAYYLTEWVKNLEPIINSVIEKIGFEASFSLDKKGDFDIKLSKAGAIYKYKDLSAGQKLIMSIAFKLAILLERNEEGIIVADEGFSSLDAENLNHIFNLFQGLPFQLLCILHRFDEKLDNVKVIDLNKGVK